MLNPGDGDKNFIWEKVEFIKEFYNEENENSLF